MRSHVCHNADCVIHSYRYQLEAFVDKVRGRTPQAWRTAEDSINSMRVIDAIYEKVRLEPCTPTMTD